ncbi:MAG: TolC family protein [Candidatus Glassbacteria bacterium]|nr:TolC family protein [Candidatus Glassbacteria bacterium]
MQNTTTSPARALILLAVLAAAAFPPAAGAMTLDEAVAYAMDHNRDILSVREQITQRKGQVTEARADAFPEVNLALSGYRVRDPGFLNSTFGQSLLKGGGTGEDDFPIPIEAIMPKPQTFYVSTLNLHQPLFTWGKVSNAVKLANLGIDEVDLQLETTRQDVAFQVTGAYYDVLLAGEKVTVYEKSIEVQQRYLKQTRDYLEVGDATRLDLLRAESQLAATEPGLLQARHNLVQARKNLNFLLGRPLDTELSAVPVDDPANLSAPGLDSVAGQALAARPDLRRLDVQTEMYGKTINVFKADYRPRVDLNASYGFSTIDTRNQLDRDYEAWRVAVEVSVPVFDGFRNRGIVRQYKSQQVQKEIETAALSERIRLEARQAIDAFISAVEVFKARQVALSSAEEQERVTADMYEQGLATSYELLDSNQKTIQARTDYLDSRYNLLLQRAALKKVMGTPVEKLF